MNEVDSQNPTILERYGPLYRHRGASEGKNERWKRRLSENERERSRCIDRRHKIHFMTWTLSSDWCISRRIASQIKRSSTLEPPLTTSPGPRRRRTIPSTLVCISPSPFLSLYLHVSLSSSFAIHVGRFIGKISRVRQSPSRSHTYRSFASLFTYGPVMRKESLDYLPPSSRLVWRWYLFPSESV